MRKIISYFLFLMVPHSVGWRLSPQPEVHIELSDSSGAVYSQRLELSASSLLLPAVDYAALAGQLQLATPTTFGLLPLATVASLLGALGAAVKEREDEGEAPGRAQAGSEGEALASQPLQQQARLAAAAPASALSSIGDLQRAGPAMLQAAKAKMEVVFQAHRVAQDDPSFVYDKRVAFSQAVESSDWD
jgi:hypothetical protein